MRYMASVQSLEEAYKQVEIHGEAVFAFDQTVSRSIRGLAARCAGRSWIEYGEDAAMRAQDRLLEEAERTWMARAACEQAIGIVNEEEFRALDAAIGVAQSCLRMLERRSIDGVPDDVRYVISTLGTRAQATCHEISALLRAGFPSGARARWRTLHEVAVVSSVLMLGNRHTASRFMNHRWVMLARDLDHDTPVSWSSAEGPTPEVMRKRLIRRYGASYAGRYGWAALVTKREIRVARPQWHHLESVARLADGHRPRVKSAHHSVHVDSFGGLDLIDATGLLHAGARLDGSQPVVWQTLVALAELTDSLIGIWQRYDDGPMVVACRAYADRMLFEFETDVARSQIAL